MTTEFQAEKAEAIAKMREAIAKLPALLYEIEKLLPQSPDATYAELADLSSALWLLANSAFQADQSPLVRYYEEIEAGEREYYGAALAKGNHASADLLASLNLIPPSASSNLRRI